MDVVRRIAHPLRASPLLLLAVPALALLLLACGSDDDDEGSAAVAAGGGGVSAAAPTPTPLPTLSVEDQAVAAWAERVCNVSNRFAISFRASGDPRDPRTLELEPRKQRAEAMFPVQIEAVTLALRELERVEPPQRTADLHAMLRQTYRDLLGALDEQWDVIRAAQSTEQIATSNLAVDQLIDLAFRQALLAGERRLLLAAVRAAAVR